MSRPVTRSAAIFEIMQSLRQIFRAIQDYSQEVFKKFGITGPQLWALKTLFADGSLSLGEEGAQSYSGKDDSWLTKAGGTKIRRDLFSH